MNTHYSHQASCKPKVSVVMPIYNTQPEHLHASIQSILSQTFTNFEFLILNDSPDNSTIEQIVHTYDDPRIVYLTNEKNLGITASRNKLMELANGEYIAIFDHDDISLPTRLEKQALFLDENPFVGCVSSNVQWFPKKYITRHPEHNIAIKREMMDYNAFSHTAMMLRKDVIIKSGVRYEEKYSPAEDYMLVIRLMDYTLLHNIQDILVHYRWHEKNTTNLQEEKMGDSLVRVKCRAHSLYPFLYEEQKLHSRKKIWFRLFFILPILKVKNRGNKSYYYLFGVIPLISTYRKK